MKLGIFLIVAGAVKLVVAAVIRHKEKSGR